MIEPKKKKKHSWFMHITIFKFNSELSYLSMTSEIDIEEDDEVSEISTHPENLEMEAKFLNSCNGLHQPSSYAGQVSAGASLEEDLLYPHQLT